MATSVVFRSAPNTKPWASSSANTRQAHQKTCSLTCAWRQQCRDCRMWSSSLGLSSPSGHKPASFSPLACLSSPSSSSASSPETSTKLYISGLSFRTTEESLRNAFQKFGQLVEVNLVMDRIAKRPRGFAFLRYATEEESQSAIKGMHGKVTSGDPFAEIEEKWRRIVQVSDVVEKLSHGGCLHCNGFPKAEMKAALMATIA